MCAPATPDAVTSSEVPVHPRWRSRLRHGHGTNGCGCVGAIYVLIGILGFVPPLVTGGARAGMDSASGSLLGILPINAVHNVVHLAIGGALLYGATATSTASAVMKIVGGAYIVVGLLGFVAPNGFGLLPLGGADILLHLATGAILLGVAFMSPADVDDVRAT